MAASENNFVGVISPGGFLTRAGKEVYIASWSKFTASGDIEKYPWWVEDREGGYSVDEIGRHMKGAVTPFDIVSRVQMIEEST